MLQKLDEGNELLDESVLLFLKQIALINLTDLLLIYKKVSKFLRDFFVYE